MARPWRLGAGGAAGVALRQRIEQRPGLLQIRGVEPFGEPAVDRREKVATGPRWPVLSSAHFSVDGSLMRAWASLKSFRQKVRRRRATLRNPEPRLRGERLSDPRLDH
jgi:hypothetical protein